MSKVRELEAFPIAAFEKKHLIKACEELGYIYDEDIKEVRNTSNRERVDAGLRTKDGVVYPMGFRFEKDAGQVKLSVVCDTFELRRNQTEISKEFECYYGKYSQLEKLEKQGWRIRQGSAGVNQEHQPYVELIRARG